MPALINVKFTDHDADPILSFGYLSTVWSLKKPHIYTEELHLRAYPTLPARLKQLQKQIPPIYLHDADVDINDWLRMNVMGKCYARVMQTKTKTHIVNIVIGTAHILKPVIRVWFNEPTDAVAFRMTFSGIIDAKSE